MNSSKSLNIHWMRIWRVKSINDVAWTGLWNAQPHTPSYYNKQKEIVGISLLLHCIPYSVKTTPKLDSASQ